MRASRNLRFGLLALSLAMAAKIAAGSDVADATGHNVVVPDNPSHILSLCTSVTDTLLRLGAGQRLAAIDEYSRVVPGTSNIVVLGKGGAISREQVLARQIDLAFVWWYQEDTAKVLENLGVPVVRVRCGRAREIPATVQMVGIAVGLTKRADELARALAVQLSGLRRETSATASSVYLELYTPFKTVGTDSYLSDLILFAGGRNVVGETSGSILLSTEQLLVSEPDIVLLVDGFATADSFAKRNGMGGLGAVKTGRVRLINRYWLIAGAGLPEAIRELRGLIDDVSKPNK